MAGEGDANTAELLLKSHSDAGSDLNHNIHLHQIVPIVETSHSIASHSSQAYQTPPSPEPVLSQQPIQEHRTRVAKMVKSYYFQDKGQRWTDEERHAHQIMVQEFGMGSAQVYKTMGRIYGENWRIHPKREKLTASRIRDDWNGQDLRGKPNELWQYICQKPGSPPYDQAALDLRDQVRHKILNDANQNHATIWLQEDDNGSFLGDFSDLGTYTVTPVAGSRADAINQNPFLPPLTSTVTAATAYAFNVAAGKPNAVPNQATAAAALGYAPGPAPGATGPTVPQPHGGPAPPSQPRRKPAANRPAPRPRGRTAGRRRTRAATDVSDDERSLSPPMRSMTREQLESHTTAATGQMIRELRNFRYRTLRAAAVDDVDDQTGQVNLPNQLPADHYDQDEESEEDGGDPRITAIERLNSAAAGVMDSIEDSEPEGLMNDAELDDFFKN